VAHFEHHPKVSFSVHDYHAFHHLFTTKKQPGFFHSLENPLIKRALRSPRRHEKNPPNSTSQKTVQTIFIHRETITPDQCWTFEGRNLSRDADSVIPALQIAANAKDMTELISFPFLPTFRDPAGSVELRPDGAYRTIHAPFDAEILDFLATPFASQLVAEGRLVASEVA
jgi:hypothetical protein